MSLPGRWFFWFLPLIGFFFLLSIPLYRFSWHSWWSLWFCRIFCIFSDTVLSKFAGPYHMFSCSQYMPWHYFPACFGFFENVLAHVYEVACSSCCPVVPFFFFWKYPTALKRVILFFHRCGQNFPHYGWIRYRSIITGDGPFLGIFRYQFKFLFLHTFGYPCFFIIIYSDIRPVCHGWTGFFKNQNLWLSAWSKVFQFCIY